MEKWVDQPQQMISAITAGKLAIMHENVLTRTKISAEAHTKAKAAVKARMDAKVAIVTRTKDSHFGKPRHNGTG